MIKSIIEAVDPQVEGVHFVDPLHGECYVELASTGDLAPALEKHALRSVR